MVLQFREILSRPSDRSFTPSRVVTNLISTLYTNYAISKRTISKATSFYFVTRRELWLTLLRFDVSLIYKAMYLQYLLQSTLIVFSPLVAAYLHYLLLFHKRDEGSFRVIKR